MVLTFASPTHPRDRMFLLGTVATPGIGQCTGAVAGGECAGGLLGALVVWVQAQPVLTSFTTSRGVRIKDTFVFVHSCTHTGVWVVHMFLRVYICCNRRVYVGTYVCAHKDTHLHMHLCWHVWVRACMSVSYVCIDVCTRVCTHTYMHTCVYARVCVCSCVHRPAPAKDGSAHSAQ